MPALPSWENATQAGSRNGLDIELDAVQPKLVVCLGATATGVLFGRDARVGALRGRQLELPDGRQALVTVHASAALRARDGRKQMRAGLLADLEHARRLLERQ